MAELAFHEPLTGHAEFDDLAVAVVRDEAEMMDLGRPAACRAAEPGARRGGRPRRLASAYLDGKNLQDATKGHEEIVGESLKLDSGQRVR